MPHRWPENHCRVVGIGASPVEPMGGVKVTIKKTGRTMIVGTHLSALFWWRDQRSIKMPVSHPF
jgi:hypothetical protein